MHDEAKMPGIRLQTLKHQFCGLCDTNLDGHKVMQRYGYCKDKSCSDCKVVYRKITCNKGGRFVI